MTFVPEVVLTLVMCGLCVVGNGAVAFWCWKFAVACMLLMYYIAQKAFVCTCSYMKIFDTTSRKCWDLGIIKRVSLLFLDTQIVDGVFWNVL